MMKRYLLLWVVLHATLFAVCQSEQSDDVWLRKASQIVEHVRKQFAPDKRTALFDVSCTLSKGSVMLRGCTTQPLAKSTLLESLKKEGCRVIDSLQVLPDVSALEGKAYGVVNLSVCNLRVQSDFSSEMTTQALLGMPVTIVRHQSWYQIQTPDNYIAWVHRAGIYPMTKAEYTAWNSAEKIVVTSHYGFTYEQPNEHSQTVSDVVAGNRLRWNGTSGSFYKVIYPDGRQAYIPQSIATPEKIWRASLKQDAQSIIQTAYTLMGIPYLWAGTSSKGVDCSGFVRTVLFMHDIIIPRDASQQAYVGQHIDIAPDFKNVQPGDLIFFGRKASTDQKEKVSHVGIYLGNKKFIHSMGDVHVSSFHSSDKEYDAYNLERLLYAVRILPLINKQKELNTTLTNPYYNK